MDISNIKSIGRLAEPDTEVDLDPLEDPDHQSLGPDPESESLVACW